MRARVLVICATTLCVACGGKVESGAPNADAAADAAWDFSSQALPPCVLGVPVATSESCPYIVAGRCYATKLDACACACPKNHDSVCISDYPSSNAPAWVSCD